MKSKPKVSIVVPVYNAEKYLNECLDSIINQTLKDIEIICVNDGSKDSSLDILNSYAEKDERFIIISQENQGAGEARNHGMSVATGEYIIFLDSDDFFELNMLEELYESAIKYCSDLVICGYYTFNTGHTSKPVDDFLNFDMVPLKTHFSSTDIEKYILNFSNSIIWNKLFKLSTIEKYNLRFPCICRMEDFYFNKSFCGLCDIISVVPLPLVHYRTNNSNSLSSNIIESPTDFLISLESIKETLLKFNRYENIKQSFVNLALSTSAFFLWVYKGLDQQIYEDISESLFNKYFDIFEITNKPKSYFYKENEYKAYIYYSRDRKINKLRTKFPLMYKIVKLIWK